MKRHYTSHNMCDLVIKAYGLVSLTFVNASAEKKRLTRVLLVNVHDCSIRLRSQAILSLKRPFTI